jgi:hypothetical protein
MAAFCLFKSNDACVDISSIGSGSIKALFKLYKDSIKALLRL